MPAMRGDDCGREFRQGRTDGEHAEPDPEFVHAEMRGHVDRCADSEPCAIPEHGEAGHDAHRVAQELRLRIRCIRKLLADRFGLLHRTALDRPAEHRSGEQQQAAIDLAEGAVLTHEQQRECTADQHRQRESEQTESGRQRFDQRRHADDQTQIGDAAADHRAHGQRVVTPCKRDRRDRQLGYGRTHRHQRETGRKSADATALRQPRCPFQERVGTQHHQDQAADQHAIGFKHRSDREWMGPCRIAAGFTFPQKCASRKRTRGRLPDPARHVRVDAPINRACRTPSSPGSSRS